MPLFFAQARARKFQEQANGVPDEPGSSSSFEQNLRSQDYLPVYGTRGRETGNSHTGVKKGKIVIFVVFLLQNLKKKVVSFVMCYEQQLKVKGSVRKCFL